MKKIIIPEVEIEIGDNLYLRITDVSFLPAVKGYTSGMPEDCYPDEPAEIDWDNKNAQLVIKEFKFKPTMENSRMRFVDSVKEKEFPVDDSFVYEYYEQIITAIEEEEW